MTQLLDRPAPPPAALTSLRPDYRSGHAPLTGLLVALPCAAVLWALVALLAYLAVR